MQKYIIYWGNGDGITYHEYQVQPFETSDITEWEYNLLTIIDIVKTCKLYYDIEYFGIELPVTSNEFSYEIYTLNNWFNKFKKI